MRNHVLDYFFNPQSIAVIGASPKEQTIGFTLVENLRKDGFRGHIYPINPKYEQIMELQAYPSLTAVQAPIDLAIIAVPIKGVPEIIKECGQAQVPGAIIISAGGKETGVEGKELEAAIKAEAERSGVRYLGPNCMGILCPPNQLNASFAALSAAPGNLALLSQSGAICSAILDWAATEKIGFSHFVSIGSMADIDFADMIDYLGNDEKVQSHHYLHGKYDPSPQIHERRPLRLPDQTHHRGQIRPESGGRQGRSLPYRGHGRAGCDLQCRLPAGRHHPGGHHLPTLWLRRRPEQDATSHRRESGHHHQRRRTRGDGGGRLRQWNGEPAILVPPPSKG